MNNNFYVICVYLLYLVTLPLIFFPASAQSEEVAICGPVSGQSYFHFSGIWEKNKSGWSKDGISKGRTVLKKIKNNEYDLLFVDATGLPTSARQEGGKVLIIRKSKREIAVMHGTSKVIEIYNFYKENDGSLKYDHLQNKGGGLPIEKSSLFTGKCYSINFD